MIGVAAGIAAIFGAPSIVSAISGDEGGCTCKEAVPGSTHDGKIYKINCSDGTPLQ